MTCPLLTLQPVLEGEVSVLPQNKQGAIAGMLKATAPVPVGSTGARVLQYNFEQIAEWARGICRHIDGEIEGIGDGPPGPAGAEGAPGAKGDSGTPPPLATTTEPGIVELAENNESQEGLVVQSDDDRLMTVEELMRKYLLLLKQWVIIGLPVPSSLHEDIPQALATE